MDSMDKRPFQTPRLLLEQSGKGTLRQFELFPGIELSQTRLVSEHITLEHEAYSDILEINYCREGRIGWNMTGGMSAISVPGIWTSIPWTAVRYPPSVSPGLL